MATHDRKPRGAAGVHFAPSSQHAQMQHMSCAEVQTGKDKHKRQWRENKYEGSKFNRNRYCSFPRNESDPLTAASHALHTRHIQSSPSITVYCHTNVLYV